MANTYYDSTLTAAEIDSALKAIDGVIVPANNGKIVAIENGKIVPKSATDYIDLNLQAKTVTPGASQQVVSPDSGYNGLSAVTVNGDADLVSGNIKKDVEIFGVTGSYEGGSPTLQSKTVTPGASQQTVQPDSGYDGLSSVVVNGDADLVAGNIKKDVEIFGITGSYEGSGGGSRNPYPLYDSDYVMESASLICTLNGREFTKHNSTLAYAAYYYDSSASATFPVLVSENEEAVFIDVLGYQLEAGGSFQYAKDGKTYYYSERMFSFNADLVSTGGFAKKLSGSYNGIIAAAEALLDLAIGPHIVITQNGDYSPPSGYNCFSGANVQIPLGTKSITEDGFYFASDDGLAGYSSVYVQGSGGGQFNLDTIVDNANTTSATGRSASITTEKNYDHVIIVAFTSNSGTYIAPTLSASAGVSIVQDQIVNNFYYTKPYTILAHADIVPSGTTFTASATSGSASATLYLFGIYYT